MRLHALRHLPVAARAEPPAGAHRGRRTALRKPLMDYQLEIPGGIPLGAFDFIVTWNQLAESRAVARARLTAGTPQVFDLSTVNGTRLVLGNVTPGTTLESRCPTPGAYRSRCS